MRDIKDKYPPCQFDSYCSKFAQFPYPVCIRNANSDFIYYNLSFAKEFGCDAKSYAGIHLNDIPCFSNELSFYLTRLEFEVSFVKDNFVQCRNILIKDTVWQVRIEMLTCFVSVYYLWQFNRFKPIKELSSFDLIGLSKEKTISFHDVFFKLTEKEKIIFPFVVIGCGAKEISSILKISEDATKKRVKSVMCKVGYACNPSLLKFYLLDDKNLQFIILLIREFIDGAVVSVL